MLKLSLRAMSKAILAAAAGAALATIILSRKKPLRLVRHVVLFALKPEADADAFVAAFDEVGVKLKALGIILSYERGVNNSSEGLTKGLTHAFVLTFKTAKDRDAYLPHPIHDAFVEKWVKPNISDVTVLDYEVVEAL